MFQNIAPPTEKFYTINDMIADLKAGKFKTPNKPIQPAAPKFQAGQRVTLDYCGKQREGTVMEALYTGYVRVELDRVTMHEWAHEDRLLLVEDVVLVGATVYVSLLGISAEVIAVLPPLVEGGVTVYRVRWDEAAAKDGKAREANVWRQDVMLVESKTASR